MGVGGSIKIIMLYYINYGGNDVFFMLSGGRIWFWLGIYSFVVMLEFINLNFTTLSHINFFFGNIDSFISNILSTKILTFSFLHNLLQYQLLIIYIFDS